ncbi:MAG TPA: hypothetical protein VIJ35_21185 [Bradyrhizobium sp.]
MTGFSRALPFGATLVDRNRARFRLFAPAQPSVAVDIEDAQSIPMQPQGDGWFEAEVPCDAGDVGPKPRSSPRRPSQAGIRKPSQKRKSRSALKWL